MIIYVENYQAKWIDCQEVSQPIKANICCHLCCVPAFFHPPFPPLQCLLFYVFCFMLLMLNAFWLHSSDNSKILCHAFTSSIPFIQWSVRKQGTIDHIFMRQRAADVHLENSFSEILKTPTTAILHSMATSHSTSDHFCSAGALFTWRVFWLIFSLKVNLWFTFLSIRSEEIYWLFWLREKRFRKGLIYMQSRRTRSLGDDKCNESSLVYNHKWSTLITKRDNSLVLKKLIWG